MFRNTNKVHRKTVWKYFQYVFIILAWNYSWKYLKKSLYSSNPGDLRQKHEVMNMYKMRISCGITSEGIIWAFLNINVLILGILRNGFVLLLHFLVFICICYLSILVGSIHPAKTDRWLSKYFLTDVELTKIDKGWSNIKMKSKCR